MLIFPGGKKTFAKNIILIPSDFSGQSFSLDKKENYYIFYNFYFKYDIILNDWFIID